MREGGVSGVSELAEFVGQWSFITDESLPTSPGQRGPPHHLLLHNDWLLLPPLWQSFFLDSHVSLDATLSSLTRLSVPPSAPPSLDAFVSRVAALCAPLPDVGPLPAPRLSLSDARGLKPKKIAEIELFAALVARECAALGCERVVDVGAGQGFLARTLASVWGLHVVALEGDEVSRRPLRGAHLTRTRTMWRRGGARRPTRCGVARSSFARCA